MRWWAACHHRKSPPRISLVSWEDGKQLPIAPQKSTVTLFSSDTHQSRLHPTVWISDPVAPLNKTPKILGVWLDDPNAPPLIFGGVLEERAYHLVRRLLRGRMIEDIVRSQAPNKVLMATPSNRPSRKTAAPVLPKRPFLAPIRLLLKAKSYRHSVGWADDPTCSDCQYTNHTLDHLFSCPTHPRDLTPEDMCVAPLQVAQFIADLPQFSDLPPLQINLDSFPS